MQGNWEILCGSTLVFKRVIVLYIIQSETMFVFWNCSKGELFRDTRYTDISYVYALYSLWSSLKTAVRLQDQSFRTHQSFCMCLF